jgi:glutamate synthase (NADPH/NADH) large chain
MLFIAEEVREIMASLGFRTFKEMIGQVQMLRFERPHKHWKARGLDFSKVLSKPKAHFPTDLFRTKEQNHELDKQLDNDLIRKSRAALDYKQKVQFDTEVTNLNRTVGGMLAGEVARKYGEDGLPDDTIEITFRGTAGQSFGAFVNSGITLRLVGEANDYVGKGLSGGKLIIKTPEKATYDPSENIIVGNTCFYGATRGSAYVNGMGGERFAVRNSGAVVVVEGIGDHGCEYMTGGEVIVLGNTGRNFAAGMSGGIAYVWDKSGNFARNVNMQMVELERLTDSEEIDKVLHQITLHKEYTGSRVATEILKNWKIESGKIVKVIPTDYKKALQKLKNSPKQNEGVKVHG